MAFAGLVLGYLVVGVIFGVVGSEALMLAAAPVMTGLGAWFYGMLGPRWAEAVEDVGDPDPAPPVRIAPQATTPLTVGATIIAGIVAALLGSIAVGWGFELIGLQVQEQSRVLDIVRDAQTGGFGPEAIMLIVSALVLAPVAEEWLFRGLLFRRVGERSGRALAYGISAVAFAAIHGNPAGFVVYLWLGLVFAAVLEHTGRLWPAIAVHMGNNGYVLVLLFTTGAPGT